LDQATAPAAADSRMVLRFSHGFYVV